jgi:hypothetical protein
MAKAVVTSYNASPDLWCGLVGHRPRPPFNQYRDIFIGHFVIFQPEDPHIHPMWYGRVIQPPHLNKPSQ